MSKFYEYLEELMDEVFEDLKDEFKNIPIILKDELNREAKGTCSYFTNPPTVTIYGGTLEYQITPLMKQELKRLLSHELMHSLQQSPTSSLQEQVNQKEAHKAEENISRFFKAT